MQVWYQSLLLRWKLSLDLISLKQLLKEMAAQAILLRKQLCANFWMSNSALLQKGGKVIPAKAQIWAQLVQCDFLAQV